METSIDYEYDGQTDCRRKKFDGRQTNAQKE